MDLGFEGGFDVLAKSVNPQMCTDYVDESLGDGYLRLKKNRFWTVFANDISYEARNVWVNYFVPRGHRPYDYHMQSIVDLVKDHQDGRNVFPKAIDVVTGGFPCQDFSLAGKRNGFRSHKNHVGRSVKSKAQHTETRGQLYKWMKQTIAITQPKIFIAENVKALASFADMKEAIRADFSTINNNGYLVLPPKVLHAADFGVPQSRERLFFIGVNKAALKPDALHALSQATIPSQYDPFPKPTHAYTQQGQGLVPPVTLKHIFQYLDEPEFSSDLSQIYYSKAKYMGSHCQGQTEVNLEGISPTIRAEHHGNIEFRRLSIQNGGLMEQELAMGMKERRLTTRECALIQSFPPNFQFVTKGKNGRRGSFSVSPTKAYQAIGNALPPLLAYHLARRIEQVWPAYFG